MLTPVKVTKKAADAWSSHVDEIWEFCFYIKSSRGESRSWFVDECMYTWGKSLKTMY